jgi:hypothetical protein
LGAQLDDVLETAAAEVEATGNISMPDPPLNTRLPTSRSLIASGRQSNGTRKFSGSYDNIPESWKKIVDYMDEDENNFLLHLPIDNVGYKYWSNVVCRVLIALTPSLYNFIFTRNNEILLPSENKHLRFVQRYNRDLLKRNF